MKRLFLLFSAFALVTALSACDLFNPEVVEEISEEYCRDNPDSEVCQGESVGDLQDDAILNVFNTILAEYNDTSQTTFCEDYFSVTNTELLDACRASRAGLFPEDVSDFTIEDVSKLASLSTVDRFEITVLSPDKQTRYVFEIGLVMVEGIMYINSWGYETETVDPTTLTVPFEDAEAYLEQFLADYTNDNINSPTLCQTYLDYVNDCATDRDASLADDFTAVLSNLTESNGTYTATIQTTSTSGGSETMTMTITFAYDSNGDIVMTIEDDGGEQPTEYTFEDYRAFLDELFQAFFHSTRTAEDVCSSYFIPEDYNFCMEGHAQKEAGGYLQEIGSFVPYEDHYLLMVNHLEGTAVVDQIAIEVWFHDTENGLRVQFVVQEDNPDEYDTFWALLEAFVNDYNNTSLSDDAAVDPYFDTATATQIKADRQKNLGDGIRLVLEDLYQDFDGDWYFVLNVAGGAPEDSETYGVLFFEDAGSWRMSLTDLDPSDNFDAFVQHVEAFFAAFNNPAISNDDAVDPFVDPMQAAEMKAERDRVLAAGDSIEFNELFFNENGRLYIDMTFYENGTPINMAVQVYFYPDEFGEWKMVIDMDGSIDNKEIFEQHVEAFFQSFNDPALSDDDAVDPFIDPMQAADVKADRQDLLAQGYWVEFLRLYEQDGRWFVEVRLHEDVVSEPMQMEVHFYYDDNDQLKMTIKEEANEDDYELYLQHLQAFFDAYANPALTDDQAVDPFFDPMQAPDIKLGRQDALANGHTVELIALYINEQGMWVFDLVANDGSGDMYSTIPVEFYYDDNDELKMRFWMGPNPNDDYPTYLAHLEAFIDAFNNPALSNEMAIGPFLDPSLFEELRQRRDELVFGMGGHIELMQLFFDPSGQWWMTLHIVANGEIDVDTLPIGFYHDEANVLRMWIEFEHGGDFADERTVLELFLDAFLDSNIPTPDLCERYFLDPTEPACYDLRALFVPGLDAYYNGFFTQDGMVFEIDIELFDDNNGPIRRHWRVEFAFDPNDGDLKMIVLENVPMIDWDSAQAFLDAFVQQFNDTSVTNDVFASTFATDYSYDVLLNLRLEFATERIVYYWLNEEYGKYWMAVEFTDGTTIRYDLMFHPEEGGWVADFHPHEPGNEFTPEDIWQLADDIAWEYNAGMTYDSLCSLYFGPSNMERCRNEFEAFGLIGGTLSVTNVWFLDHGWAVEFLLTNNDGSETYLTWEVVAFHDEFGTMRFDFLDNTLIPEAQMLQHLQNFITDFNGFGYDAATICGMYLAPESQAGCAELYNELMATGQQLNLYFYELRYPPFWIELLIWDPSETLSEFYLEGEVQFTIDESGQLWMNFFPGDRYTHVSEANAEGILQDLIALLNDLTTSDQDFCNEWGHLFADCFAIREQIRSGSTIVLQDWYMSYNSEITLQAQRIEAGSAVEDLYFHLTIRRDLTGALMIHGWQEIYNPPYTLAEVEAAYAALLQAYFDPAWSDEDIELQFAQGFYFPGIEFRSELLAMGYTVSLVGIESLSYEYGYEVFEAEVLLTKDGVTTTYFLRFNPWKDESGHLMVMPIYDWMLPEEAELLVLLQAMVTDFNDATITDDVFCATYFDVWSMDWCYNLREQVRQGGLSVQLGYVQRSDDRADFDLEFYDGTGALVQTLQFGYFQNYNFLEEVQPAMFLQGDTIAWDYAYDFLLEITSQLQSQTMSIADFCATYDCAGMWVDAGQTILFAELIWLDLNWDDLFTQEMQGELYIEYTDGSDLYLRIAVPYTIDENGVYHFDLMINGIEQPLPDDALLLDQAASELVLDDFLADIVDATVSAEDLCDWYLGGSMMSPDCIEGRTEWLTNGTIITRSALEPVVYDGMTVFRLSFTFTTGTVSDTMDVVVAVFQLSDGTHALMFEDVYEEDTVE